MKPWTVWLAFLLVVASSRAGEPGDAAVPYVVESLRAGEVADLVSRFPEPRDRELPASFLAALIADGTERLHRHGVRIKGAVVRDPIDLANAVVDVDVRLEDCVFEADVDLSRTSWKHELTLNGSEFQGLDLSYASVLGSLRLERVRVAKRFYGSFAHVGVALEATDAAFLDPSTTASFNSVVAGSYGRFDRATFKGGADFIVASFGTNLYLNGVKFDSETAAASFDKIRLGDSVLASPPAIFEGPVSFQGAKTARDVILTASEFRSKRATADFSAMTVGGDLYIVRGLFLGPVRFTKSYVQGLFSIDEARFGAEGGQVALNLLRVDSVMRMVGATFDAGFNLIGAELADDLNASRLSVTSGVATLYRARVGQALFLNGSTFGGPLDCSHATVGIDANFDEVHLSSAADFRGTHVQGDLSLSDARFGGAVDLSAVSVGGDLNLEKSESRAGADIDMTDLVVGRDVLLDEVTFGGSLEMLHAQIAGAVFGDAARFAGEDAEISLDSATVQRQVTFKAARFAGKVDFAALRTNDDLSLDDAVFSNAQVEVDLHGVMIAGDLGISGTTWNGSVDAQLAVIGKDLTATKAKFLGGKGDFLQIRVGGDAMFPESVFAKASTFTYASVGGYLDLSRAVVGGAEISLNSVRVGKHIFLDDARIDASLNLIAAEAGADLYFRRAQVPKPAQLARMVVHGTGRIDRVSTPSVDLSDTTFYNLQLSNLSLTDAPGDLLLTRANIQRNLELTAITATRVVASAVRVSGTARFDRVTVGSELSLENSTFESLDLVRPRQWKLKPNAMKLHAVGFREVLAEGEPDGSAALVSLLERAAYSPAAYTTFQQYFDRVGLSEASRLVFINQQRRAARENGGLLRRGWTWMLDVFVRFGKNPERAFLYAFVFVLFGGVVFDRRRMMPSKAEFDGYHYNRWWYSFDRLIPVADLGMKNVWGPQQTSRLARNYMRMHVIIGYLLFTIGLAAVTGLVR